MNHILVCPAGSTPSRLGRHLDVGGFDILLIVGDELPVAVGTGTDDLDDRLLAACSDLGLEDPMIAFASEESGLLGPVRPEELIDLLMQEILDTLDDAEETTDSHPLEMVRSALSEL